MIFCLQRGFKYEDLYYLLEKVTVIFNILVGVIFLRQLSKYKSIAPPGALISHRV